MLSNLLERIKVWLTENRRDLFLASLVFLVSIASFGLGRLSAIWPEEEPITIENYESGSMNQESKAAATASNATPDSVSQIPNSQGAYVASKSGSVYHFPECPGAKQIKEENKIRFETVEEARAAGYRPAANCPGL